jgi:RecG-like helicase
MSLLTRLRPTPTPSPVPVAAEAEPAATEAAAPCEPIGDVRWRQRVRIGGRVRSVRIQPWSGVATLECTLVDETGGIGVVFLGRRAVAGVQPGSMLVVEGMVGDHHGRLAILNPDYELVAG